VTNVASWGTLTSFPTSFHIKKWAERCGLTTWASFKGFKRPAQWLDFPRNCRCVSGWTPQKAAGPNALQISGPTVPTGADTSKAFLARPGTVGEPVAMC
jgi:hypothetical protein